MTKKKVLYVISNVDKSLQLEWTISWLSTKSFKLSFILMGESNTEFHHYLTSKGFEVFIIPLSGWISRAIAFYKTLYIIAKVKPDIVHTHLYYANVIGIPACWLMRTPRRIYTRHHATIHHDYFPFAVLIDRFLNRLATHIILPSESLRDLLLKKEGAENTKIRVIPHGFDLDYFANVKNEDVNTLKQRYNLTNSFPIIGVIARFTEWKGIQYVISAFVEILKFYPRSRLILANARGDFEKEIAELLLSIPKGNYTTIGFESNVAALYHCFDLFVHVPVNSSCEAFGQTYVEALASGIPSVFTLSGIANEFICDGVNAVVVNYRDSESIRNAIKYLIDSPEIASSLSRQGLNSVRDRFSIERMVNHLELVYRDDK